MTNPLGTADFFALEVGEALDRLETLINGPEAPSAAELLRYARVVRGAALMAGHHPFAGAAGGLELFARAYRDGTRTWDASAREQLGQSVDELRLLSRRVRTWSDEDAARADRVGAALAALAGRPGEASPAGLGRREPGDVSSGVRAFVAREGALIASALDRAARALRTDPDAREPLYNVLRRMQSLRGLAELAELPPLPDVLDAIEQAIGDLSRQYAPAPAAADVVEAAAVALTRLARDVAERGRPVRDAEEPRRFTELLLQTFAVERDVVPIESLFRAGDEDPIQRPAAQPQFSAPAPLGPVELVSHGEHLAQTADLLAESHSATERGLRLYRLVGALRSASHPGPDPVAGALAVFARATREALAAGAATREPGALEACLREAAQHLKGVAERGDTMHLSRRLLDVAHRLDQLRDAGAAGEPATPALADERETRPPTESSASDADVVPIETLAYDGADVFAPAPAPAAAERPAAPEPSEPSELPIVPIESLAPDAPDGALARTFATYRRLSAESGHVAPSLAALVGAATAPAAEPAPAAAAPAGDAAVVDITRLCYRGRAALERAAELREEIRRHLAASGDLAAVRPMMDELLDLVPLALDDA